MDPTNNRGGLVIALLISFIALNAVLVDAAGPVPCNGTTVEITNLSGKLVLDPAKQLGVNKSCAWSLNNVNATTDKLYFVLRDVVLGDGDTLEITDVKDGAKRDFLFTKDIIKSGQLIHLSTLLNANITLNTSAIADRERRFNVFFNRDTTYSLSLNQVVGNRIIFPSFNQTLKPNLDFSIAVDVDPNRLDQEQDFHAVLNKRAGTIKVMKDKTEIVDLSNAESGDYVHNSQVGNVKIEFSNQPTEAQSIDLLLRPVNADCSHSQKLAYNQTLAIVTPALQGNPKNIWAFKCVNILQGESEDIRQQVDLSHLKPVSNSDTLTLRDGPSMSSPILALVSGSQIESYANKYISTSGRYLYVEYDCPLATGTEVPASIQISAIKSGGRVTSGTALRFDSSQAESTWLVPYDTSVQINSVTLANAIVQLYDRNDAKAKPFATFNTNIPNVLPPPVRNGPSSDEWVIKISNVGPGTKFDALANKSTCNSSLVTSGIVKIANFKSECSLLIPSQSDPENLRLDLTEIIVSKDSKISLSKWNDKLDEVLSIVQPTVSHSIPPLSLIRNNSYLLTFSCPSCNGTSGPDSLTVSVDLAPGLESVVKVSLLNNVTQSIFPITYPLAYPLEAKFTWALQNENDNSSMVLVEYEEIDLGYKSKLNLMKDVNTTLTELLPSANGQIPGDSIGPHGALLVLDSTLDKPELDATQRVGGRGFRANVTSLNCAVSLKLKASETQALTIKKEDFKNAASCLVLVESDPIAKTTTKMTTIQIHNATSDQAVIISYIDSNLYRDRLDVNRILNQTILPNETLSSSTPSLFIKVDLKDATKPLNVDFSLTSSACPKDQLCRNGQRCLLPQFHCNGRNDCGDWSDEVGCNGTAPPPPTPEPVVVYRGVSGVALVFLLPMAAAIGAVCTLYGPNMMRKIRAGRAYNELGHSLDA